MRLRSDELDRDLFLFRGSRYDSGSLVALAGEKALLVDGMASVEDAHELRRTLETDWGKRVELLISTHYFSDHMAAWNLFPQASVLAHQNAVQTFWMEQFRTPEHARNLASIEARGLFREAA